MTTLTSLRAGKLAGLQRLDLSAGLTQFPPEIYDLADSLEVLNLSGNALSSLPEDLPRLARLRILFCSDNQFEHLPEVLGACPNLSMVGFKANRIRHVPAAALPPALRWLILTDNAVENLPPELGRCTQLQKLMLAGNRLSTLPEEMAACSNLELLRIAANRLASLPDWLLKLPRLAWLAFAGNPFCDISEAAVLARHPIAPIPWEDLELTHQLGEGASGVIYHAQRRSALKDLPDVAVKVFKGSITSDGLPGSEMDACICAGRHPNLIPLEGRIFDHPDGADGLVMSLIDRSFHNLAGPPSLASCTRDTYAPGTRFSPDALLRIATGIAAAAAHLHDQGILHGDLYGHNILHNDKGDCLLGDFGAASFFVPEDRARAEALQRLEVRAFGCLLEELLARCTAPMHAPGPLRTLQARCVDENSTSRPLFHEITKSLAALRLP